MALATFEQLKDEAVEAAEAERLALNAIWKLKRKIRQEALSRGNSGLELGEAPEEMVIELRRLTDEAMQAKERKLTASAAAQQARIAFNELFRARQPAETEAVAS